MLQRAVRGRMARGATRASLGSSVRSGLAWPGVYSPAAKVSSQVCPPGPEFRWQRRCDAGHDAYSLEFQLQVSKSPASLSEAQAPGRGINKHRLGQGRRPPLAMGISRRRPTWGPCTTRASTGKRDGTSNTPTQRLHVMALRAPRFDFRAEISAWIEGPSSWSRLTWPVSLGKEAG
jgi:hypothetical protein